MPRPALALSLIAATCLLPAQDPLHKPMSWTGVLSEADFAALHELKEGKAPALHGSTIELAGAMAYLSLPAKPSTAAVLVIHEWWGLNTHIKHWADRLAADGYAALAVDLYGGVVATTRDEAMASMQGIDETKALQTLVAAHRFLKDDARVRATRRACIGWCFGGGWSLKLAMAAPDLDAAVIYYGRLVDDPEQLARIGAPILGVFGDRDSGIPPKSVDAFAAAMKKAGKPFTVHRYDANHAFANPSSARYDKANATKAWTEVRGFLRQHLLSGGRFSDGSRELAYDIPEGWSKADSRPMRQVNLKAAGDTECYVAVMPGEAGGLLANVNRWQQQMGAHPLSAEQIGALPRLAMLGGEGVCVRIEGSYRGMSGPELQDAVMIAVVLTRPEETMFVKMIGPAAQVTAQEKAFDAFCRSLR